MTAALWGLEGKTAPPCLQPLRCPGSRARPAAEWTWQVRGAVLFMGVSSRGSLPTDDSCVRNPWALNGSTLTHFHIHLYIVLHTHFYVSAHTHKHSHAPLESAGMRSLGDAAGIGINLKPLYR